MTYARPFRLHHSSGILLDGAVFPSGHAIVIDEPGVAFSAAASLEQLLLGYHRARIEWPGDEPGEQHAAQAEQSDPTECSGEAGPCPEHGHHETSLKQPGEASPSPLRDQVAAALYERERPPNDPPWADAYACDREVFGAMTDTVLAVVQPAAQRVNDLYERWVKAGPPPLGASLARWWDQRLVELRAAILPPDDQPADGGTEMVTCPSCLGAPFIPRADLDAHNARHHPHHPQEQP
ncbi:hypothetical protein ABZ690_34330 [Streptomyces sp. NPDC006967]|uniref:hypothetical protein n=1 Tax=Streptomyces sp. NPDC006967 TaxID=3156906 RepID=UPI0033E9B259